MRLYYCRLKLEVSRFFLVGLLWYYWFKCVGGWGYAGSALGEDGLCCMMLDLWFFDGFWRIFRDRLERRHFKMGWRVRYLVWLPLHRRFPCGNPLVKGEVIVRSPLEGPTIRKVIALNQPISFSFVVHSFEKLCWYSKIITISDLTFRPKSSSCEQTRPNHCQCQWSHHWLN